VADVTARYRMNRQNIDNYIMTSSSVPAKVLKNLKSYGLKTTAVKCASTLMSSVFPYDRWVRGRFYNTASLRKQSETHFDYEPRLSVVIPLYNSNPEYLAMLIESVRSQTYSNWELCLSDGSPEPGALGCIVDAYEDERIRYIVGETGGLGISDNTNQALAAAIGEYIVFGDHDDLFTPNAFYECVRVLNRKRFDIIYTDEDKIDAAGKKLSSPNFKPCFSIDYLRSTNYICHMLVVKRSLVDSVGGLRSEYDGAQDYDLVLRCVEKTRSIYHIPKPLYHWRVSEGSTAMAQEEKPYAHIAGRRALEEHLRRVGLEAEVTDNVDPGCYSVKYRVTGEPRVSVIIPNKDHIEDLDRCIGSIRERSTYRNLEIIVVENNSTEAKTYEYYRKLESGGVDVSDRGDAAGSGSGSGDRDSGIAGNRDSDIPVRVVYYDGDFNFSAINNFGVGYATGEYLLLLNNDTELRSDDAIEHMLGYCQRPEVGIVGARLYFPDGTLQHAGVVLGVGGFAGHIFSGMYDEMTWFHKSMRTCDYSIVTAACMMARRSVYDEVGGLDCGFKVALNDVDFCLRVRRKGYLVVYDAAAQLWHYESKSRGREDTPEKQKRYKDETARFQERWLKVLEKGDPYYNPNLTLVKRDFSLRGLEKNVFIKVK